MGSNSAMQEIDLAGMAISVPSRFRVGIGSSSTWVNAASCADDADGQ
jgi:hypothetical protein